MKIEPIRFFDYCDVYWKRHGQYKRSHSTESVLKVLKAHFRNPLLTEITAREIEDFRNERRKVVERSSINRNLAELKCMFSKAIQWAYAETNPVKLIKFEKENNQRVRYLTHEEIQRLIEGAKPHLKPIILTALHTGMRRGEILKLKWEHVNLKIRVIAINHTKNQEGKQIPIDRVLYDTFNGLPSKLQAEYVFMNRKGRPYQDIKKGFHATVKRAGIRNFRFHDLRHTFASHLVMNGADLATVR